MKHIGTGRTKVATSKPRQARQFGQPVEVAMPSGTERSFDVPAEGLPGGDEVEIAAEVVGMPARLVASLLAVILGTLALAVGAGLAFGVGVALMVGGGIAVVIGLLLGLIP